MYKLENSKKCIPETANSELCINGTNGKMEYLETLEDINQDITKRKKVQMFD